MSEDNTEALRKDVRRQHKVRLPGFLLDDGIGLGDVISRTTAKFGITPCGGCQRRAATLNRWLAFTRNRAK